MMRAAIYARFSTELQRDRSINDQMALCRAHAERAGLCTVATYHDSARSGASVFGRDGLEQMMEHAREKRFDVLIVEALDRLSRDMEDLAGIHKRLTFLGIEIRAVHDGTADTVLVGIRGLVGQMQREDGAKRFGAEWLAYCAMAAILVVAPTVIGPFRVGRGSWRSLKTKRTSSAGSSVLTQRDKRQEQ